MSTAHLSPYLNFDGNCREAMTFYQSCLGGKLTMQTFGEAPIPSEPAQKDRIMHAMLENDALSFMASDSMPGTKVVMGNNVHLTIAGSDEQRLRGFFDALSKGGKVTMPLAKQFWGDIFGTLTDKFGVHWMVDIGEEKN